MCEIAGCVRHCVIITNVPWQLCPPSHPFITSFLSCFLTMRCFQWVFHGKNTMWCPSLWRVSNGMQNIVWKRLIVVFWSLLHFWSVFWPLPMMEWSLLIFFVFPPFFPSSNKRFLLSSLQSTMVVKEYPSDLSTVVDAPFMLLVKGWSIKIQGVACNFGS